MNAPASCSAAVGDKNAFTPGEQYRRLFGNLSPDEVMCLPPSPAISDPSRAAEDLVASLLAACDHPSAATIAEIAAARLRHVANGHTPEADAAHGWVHFKRLADKAYHDAIAARSPENRRKRLVIAVAILVAQIDAEAVLAAATGATHEA